MALIVAIVVAGVASPTTARAQSEGNGLQENSVTRFEFDPDTDVLRVTVTTTITNVTADRREGDVVNRTYFTGHWAPVPVGATNIVAAVNGNVVQGELLDHDLAEESFWRYYEFPLGLRLFNGQTATVVVTYEHSGFEPRDDIPFRVNDAYVSFLVFGIGDDGHVDIEFVVPAGFELDDLNELDGFEAERTDDGDELYRRTGLDESFSAIVSMSNDERLTAHDMTVGQVDFVLRSWPGDEGWVTFTTDEITESLPQLEALIGQAWPIDEEFTIRQTVEPAQHGYAGWFDLSAGEIAVGEALDTEVMIHELSHGWFNRNWFTDLWLIEGFAQAYTAHLMRERNESPFPAIEPASYTPGRQPLSMWEPWDSEIEEDYGYRASYWVMEELLDEVGPNEMRRVLDRIEHSQSAYAEPSRSITTERSTGWQRIYDLLVAVAGSELADDLYADYVLDERQLGQLGERNTTAGDVADLRDRSAPWLLPVEIVRAMDSWAFNRAARVTEEAHAVLDLRDILEDLETASGIDEPETARDEYERSTSGLDAPTETLEAQIADGEALLDRLSDRDERADEVGVDMPSIVGNPTFASATDEVDRQIAALDRHLEVAELVRSDRSFTERVGLRDQDLNADLNRAAALAEQGDLVEADVQLSEITDILDDAHDRGRSDLIRWTSQAALGLLLLVTALLAIVIRRRRRSSRSSTHMSGPDPAAWPPPAHTDREPLGRPVAGSIAPEGAPNAEAEQALES